MQEAHKTVRKTKQKSFFFLKEICRVLFCTKHISVYVEVFGVRYMAKSKAFCAFIEAQIVHVTSILSYCSQTEVMVVLWAFQRKKRRELMSRAIHSCSSHLVGGCNEEVLLTTVYLESKF